MIGPMTFLLPDVQMTFATPSSAIMTAPSLLLTAAAAIVLSDEYGPRIKLMWSCVTSFSISAADSAGLLSSS